MIIYSSSPHNGFNLKTAGCTTDVCEGGGTGRRARLRCVWFILGGSNPLLRTKNQNTLCSGFFVVRVVIQNFSKTIVVQFVFKVIG